MVGQEMRDALALSILASSTVLPPSATPSRRQLTRHRDSSKAAAPSISRAQPSVNELKPRFATSLPLLASTWWDHHKSSTFHSELTSKLADEGRFEDLLMIAENAVASGMKPSEFFELVNSENVATGIAKVLGDGDSNFSVEKLFNGIRKLGIEPVQLLDGVAMESLRKECRWFLKCGQVERLSRLLEALTDFQIPVKELMDPSDGINIFVKKRDPAAAIRYVQNFTHAGMLFCTVILEFGKRKDLVSALTAFEVCKQRLSSPNLHVYRTIIDVCGLCGNYLKSRVIFEELLAGNVTPNIYVVNSLMNVNAPDLNYTLHIYKKMEEFGVSADITSHNILLKSCSCVTEVELAHDIYKEMQKLESNGALKLDVYTYSTMIKVFANVKMWKLALGVKEDMESSGVFPNAVTWSLLISACANAGLVEQAIKLFSEMLQVGCIPSSQSINIILHACIESCQFDRAFRLFKYWKDSGFHVAITDDNQADSGIFVAGNQIGFALSPLSASTVKIPFRPTTSTYNILMKACGTDYYRAKGLMDEMKTAGLFPDHISWSILIDICGDSGNVRNAVQILRFMREAGVQPDVVAYTTAIKICVKHKNPTLAYMLFGEMKKYEIKPNAVTYRTILRARSIYGSLHEVQQCLAVYQDMRKAGYKYKPNDYYLKQLIEEWCEGVIQNEQLDKGKLQSRKTDFGPGSVLLEKVAEHLKDRKAENLCIDLQGLTKVEARIIVLAVLRKIKEKYTAGHSVKDDVLVIVGIQELGPIARDKGGVWEAVIRLLQQELGLHVLAVGAVTAFRRDKVIPKTSSLKLEESIEGTGLPQATKCDTRRPIMLQRLKVTKESLNHWLRRKTRPSEQ